MYPEYFKIDGKWVLAEESRMDSSVVICDDGHLEVVENRNLKKGDKVILGRSEKCEEGIYMHCNGFTAEGDEMMTSSCSVREEAARPPTRGITTTYLSCCATSASTESIVWVMGPAFVPSTTTPRGDAGTG